MKKKLLAIGLGAALSVTAVSAMASTLTLKSQNIPSAIGVTCNGTQGIPIQPNSQVGPLPYVALVTLFGSHTLRCTFTVGGNTAGTATLIVGPSDTHAKIIKYMPYSPYSVTIANTNRNGQPVGIYSPAYDMVVTLSQ